jgi:hypothetical protein
MQVALTTRLQIRGVVKTGLIFSLEPYMQTHTFYKEAYGGWYIDLPEYLEQGGSKGDLAMVAGADTMLDIVAGANNRLTITMDTKPFEGADEIRLVRVSEPSIGAVITTCRLLKERK